MLNNIVNFPQGLDGIQLRPAIDVPKAVQPVSPAQPTDNRSDNNLQSGSQKSPAQDYSALRLTIEKDERTGDWVYKAVDRVTGQVVRQLPRQELLDMKRSVDYEAGKVIKTDI